VVYRFSGIFTGAIEFDQNETREYVNLEVHADYFVRIKTEQIKPILQVILQLYDGQSQDIKVGAYEAHTLGNIDKNIVWHGSKEVLRLAEKLHNFPMKLAPQPVQVSLIFFAFSNKING
jgi:hypothetical protein